MILFRRLLLLCLVLAPPALGWTWVRDVLWLPTVGGFQLTPDLKKRYGAQARRALASNTGGERTLGLVECLPLLESQVVLKQAVARQPNRVELRSALLGRYLSMGARAHQESVRREAAACRRLDPANAYFHYVQAWGEIVPTKWGYIPPGRLDRAYELIHAGNALPYYRSYRTRSMTALRRQLREFGLPSLEARVTAAVSLHHPESVDLGHLADILREHAERLETRGELPRAFEIYKALVGMGRNIDDWEPYLYGRVMAHHIMNGSLRRLERHAKPEEAVRLRTERRALTLLGFEWRQRLKEAPDYMKSPAVRHVLVGYVTLGAPLMLALISALIWLATLCIPRPGTPSPPMPLRQQALVLSIGLLGPALYQGFYLLFYSSLKLTSGRQLLYLQLFNFAWVMSVVLLLLVLLHGRKAKPDRLGRATLALFLLVAGALMTFEHLLEYSMGQLKLLYLLQVLSVMLVVVLIFLHVRHDGRELLRTMRPLLSKTVLLGLLLFYLAIAIVGMRRQALEERIVWYQSNPGGYLNRGQ